LPLVVTFASDLDVGSSHQFDASIHGDISDPDPLNNMDDADTSIVGIADLLVDKWTPTAIAEAGDTVIYTITVTNQGPSLASNVDVKELLPAELDLLQLSASQGACVSRICQLGALPVGETATMTVVTQVDPDTPPGTLINNTAAVFSGSMDPILVNNEALEGILVGPISDLSITKRTNITFAQPSTLIPYQIQVQNHGPSLAPAVVITDILPMGFVYQQTDSRCTLSVEEEVICHLGDLAVNEVVNLTLFALITAEAAHGAQENIVYVGSDELHDPTPVNNSDTASIQLVNVPTVVEQVTFLTVAQAERVYLQWLAPTRDTTVAFHIRRASTSSPEQFSYVTSTSIPASGSQSGAEYEFIDTTVQPGESYIYWLDEIHRDGTTTVHGPNTVTVPEQSYEILLPFFKN